MNICLGKVLEKCLNLRMTKQGEPCELGYERRLEMALETI